MKKLLSLDDVKTLIINGGFGTYMLYSMSTGESLIAGSHLASDGVTDTKMEPAKLVQHLCSQLDIFKDGNYIIALRPSSKSQTQNVVRYAFTVGDAMQQQQQQNFQMSGLPQDKVEELVMSRVSQMMAQKQAEYEKQTQIDRLMREIEELKKRKPTRQKKNDLMGLVPVLLPAAAVFIEQKWPDSKETLHKALDAVSGYVNGEDDEDEEEEEDEPKQPFKRPE